MPLSPYYDARFKRPNTITRSGQWVYVNLEFYGGQTDTLVELGAYNSAGQRINNPVFTDADGIMYCSSSGTWNGSYWVSRYFTHIYYIKDAAMSAQVASFKAWMYVNTYIIDTVPPW